VMDGRACDTEQRCSILKGNPTMLRWFAVLAVSLVLSSFAVAQEFNATLVYAPVDGAALTTTCEGATPIPDGRLIKIFWDVDSDGPDLTDPQPTICDVPPDCEGGPAGTVNFNRFAMNGTAMFSEAGYFYSDMDFTSIAQLPNPPRYYLRVYESDTTNFLWTSTVKTLVSGPQVVEFQRSDWTCGAGGPQCIVRDEHE
jgi:hypothetical protein